MKKVFKIEGLDCAHCAASIENGVKKIDGVHSAKVSFLTQKMVIEMNEADSERIAKEAIEICKDIEPDCEVSF